MNRYSIMLGKKPPSPKEQNHESSDGMMRHYTITTFSQFIEIDGHRWPAVIEIFSDPVNWDLQFFHRIYNASVTIHGTLANTVPPQSYVCKLFWKNKTITFHINSRASRVNERGEYLTTLTGEFQL